MTILILGLIIFLGIHSTRIVAEAWRTKQLARLGTSPWKGIYSLVSVVGLGLIIWGFGLARLSPVLIWTPPIAMRHIASLLTLFAFVLITAAYLPRNSIKAKLHHPMMLGVMAWAIGHLLANGTLADIILFASFLVWSFLAHNAARQRDRITHTTYPAGTAASTILTVLIGLIAWAVFAFLLHGPLIGVRPF
ncbi:MAG: NnrU family protein [Burkholderiaceae bacterium]|nr:NnrU family protein [Burkholderiaceae bacterium]